MEFPQQSSVPFCDVGLGCTVTLCQVLSGAQGDVSILGPLEQCLHQREEERGAPLSSGATSQRL